MYIVDRNLWERLCLILIAGCASRSLVAQRALTWQEVKSQFETANPSLQAARTGIEESKAQEITAYLRPNPDLTVSTDGTQLLPSQGVWRPFAGTQVAPGVSYLHEREHKRELRRDSARQSTVVAQSAYSEQNQQLLFTLRNAFNQSLQAKAILRLTRDNLDYYDRVLQVNRTRRQAGDISQVDLDRLELQRVQYESDVQNAEVSLRTAKIQLLQLLNSRTAVEQFDVTGSFEASDRLAPLEEFRQMALSSRPDLQEAMQSVGLAKINHRLALANGSADPTFNVWVTHNPSFNNPFDNNALGASVSIPLRIFDRNQGEKTRTELDIQRSQQLQNATIAQVFSDVDSAYAALSSTLTLVQRYKAEYLQQSQSVRDTMNFAYRNGGASLLDFLSAQNDYRATQLNYLNLIGSYLAAANQMNLAAGTEVLP